MVDGEREYQFMRPYMRSKYHTGSSCQHILAQQRVPCLSSTSPLYPDVPCSDRPMPPATDSPALELGPPEEKLRGLAFWTEFLVAGLRAAAESVIAHRALSPVSMAKQLPRRTPTPNLDVPAQHKVWPRVHFRRDHRGCW